MKPNLKGFLALVVLLAASIGGVAYGFNVGEFSLILFGLVGGILLCIVDWLRRKPGRKPSTNVMAIATLTGLLGPGIVLIVLGEATLRRIALVSFGIIFSICLYFLVLTLITAQKSPGYWSR